MSIEAKGETVKARGHPGQTAGLAFPSPPAIPHHTLIRRIGSGSYGEVWLAKNAMDSFRAIKIVYRSCFTDQKPFERELSGIRKFEPISRSHEGFVDVLHVGFDETAGCFFYVMEIGDDCQRGQQIDPNTYAPKTLSNEITARGKLSTTECLELGLALTRALDQLHKHKLVHRDIKPSNIVFIEGVAKLADIGLVAGVEEPRSYVGTEGFIPPEGPGTPQADVFSLGKVLYESSTGRDRHYFPELPPSLKDYPNPKRFLELNAVILRACEPNPQTRYKSAAEMQADLLVLVHGKSVLRLRQLEGTISRIKRFAVAASVIAAVGASAGYPLYVNHHAQEEARERGVGAAIAYGNRSMESGDLLGSLPYFAEALRLHHAAKSSEVIDRMRLGLIESQCPKLTFVASANDQVNDGEFSPSGSQIVLACQSSEARVYDIKSGTVSALKHGDRVLTAVFSHDGKSILTASDDGSASIWDAATLQLLHRFIHPDRVKSAVFSPDDANVLTSCRDGRARIWDVKTGKIITTVPYKKRLRFATFSHDGQLMATASEDGTAIVWKTKDGEFVKAFNHPQWVNYVAFSPDDTEIVTACADHKARLWDLTGKMRFPMLEHEDGILSAEFSPDGREILTACLDGSARRWRRDTLQPVEMNAILRCGERVTRAVFNQDGRCILTTGVNGAVRLWDLSGAVSMPETVPCISTLDGKRLLMESHGFFTLRDAADDRALGPPCKISNPFWAVPLSPNGRFALVTKPASSNKYVTMDLTTGNVSDENFQFATGASIFALADDGALVVGCHSNIIEVFSSSTKRSVTFASSDRGNIAGAFFEPQGHRLFFWGGNSVQSVDATDGRGCSPPLIFSNLVGAVSLRSNQHELVGSCLDDQWTACYAQVWNLDTRTPVGPKLWHKDGVICCSFSQDGTHIGTAGEDFTAKIWDAKGQQLGLSLQHHERVESIAFSPDGRFVVTSSGDRTARIWDAETGDPLSPPLRHLIALQGALFLVNGQRVLTTTRDYSKRIWSLPADNRPIIDVRDHVRLLAGGNVGNFENAPGHAMESFEGAWSRLKMRYPASFGTDRAEIRKWHQFAFDESKSNGNQASAAFHLGQIASLDSKPPEGRKVGDSTNQGQRN